MRCEKQYFTILIIFSEGDEETRFLVCHPNAPCIRVNPVTLRTMLADSDTITDDLDEIVDIPERRSSGYLFRSRRYDNSAEDAMKRSSGYLLRTRKSDPNINARSTRGEYLFRTRKDPATSGSVPVRAERGSYLFRTRKMDSSFVNRMLRSQSPGYLFRTR